MSTHPIIEVNHANFQETTASSPVPVLLDFGAVWCPPCRVIEPHLAALAVKYAGQITVGKVDVDGEAELAARFDVRNLPTLLMFAGGEVVGQLVGAAPRARIEALVERALAAHPQAARAG